MGVHDNAGWVFMMGQNMQPVNIPDRHITEPHGFFAYTPLEKENIKNITKTLTNRFFIITSIIIIIYIEYMILSCFYLKILTRYGFIYYFGIVLFIIKP